MDLNFSTTLPAKPEELWVFINDIKNAASVVPGLEVTGIDGDLHHSTFEAPWTDPKAVYRGAIRSDKVDEAGRALTIRAAGHDARGQSNLTVTLSVTVEGVDYGSRLLVTGDAHSRRQPLDDVDSAEFVAHITEALQREFGALLTVPDEVGPDEVVAEPAPVLAEPAFIAEPVVARPGNISGLVRIAGMVIGGLIAVGLIRRAFDID